MGLIFSSLYEWAMSLVGRRWETLGDETILAGEEFWESENVQQNIPCMNFDGNDDSELCHECEFCPKCHSTPAIRHRR